MLVLVVLALDAGRRGVVEFAVDAGGVARSSDGVLKPPARGEAAPAAAIDAGGGVLVDFGAQRGAHAAPPGGGEPLPWDEAARSREQAGAGEQAEQTRERHKAEYNVYAPAVAAAWDEKKLTYAEPGSVDYDLHQLAFDQRLTPEERVQKIEELVFSKGADLNCWDQFGQTLVYTATDLVMLKLLYTVTGMRQDKGKAPIGKAGLPKWPALVDVRNREGHTALMNVCKTRRGDWQMAKVLLNLGASIYITARWYETTDWTPLHMAAYVGKQGVTRQLLWSAAQDGRRLEYVNAQLSDGSTALLLAAEKCQDDDTGSNVDGTFNSGGSSLEVMQLLLEAGADVNGNSAHSKQAATGQSLQYAEKQTALMLAASKGRLPCLKFLLDNGANIDQLDSLGKTALWYAIESNKFNTAEYLVQRGADVMLRPADRLYFGMTPLFAAVSEDSPALVRLLLDNAKRKDGPDADIRVQSGQGERLLQHATRCHLRMQRGNAKGRDLFVENLLLDYAPDLLNAENGQGANSAWLASWGHKRSLLEFLLARGSSANGLRQMLGIYVNSPDRVPACTRIPDKAECSDVAAALRRTEELELAGVELSAQTCAPCGLGTTQSAKFTVLKKATKGDEKAAAAVKKDQGEGQDGKKDKTVKNSRALNAAWSRRLKDWEANFEFLTFVHKSSLYTMFAWRYPVFSVGLIVAGSLILTQAVAETGSTELGAWQYGPRWTLYTGAALVLGYLVYCLVRAALELNLESLEAYCAGYGVQVCFAFYFAALCYFNVRVAGPVVFLTTGWLIAQRDEGAFGCVILYAAMFYIMVDAVTFHQKDKRRAVVINHVVLLVAIEYFGWKLFWALHSLRSQNAELVNGLWLADLLIAAIVLGTLFTLFRILWGAESLARGLVLLSGVVTVPLALMALPLAVLWKQFELCRERYLERRFDLMGLQATFKLAQDVLFVLPLAAAYVVSDWGLLLELANQQRLELVSALLDRLPWPVKHNFKCVELAKNHRVDRLAVEAGLSLAPPSARDLATMDLWNACDPQRGAVFFGLDQLMDAYEAPSSVGVDIPGATGGTFLELFARQGKVQHVDYLLQIGAKVNATNSERRTPLHVVAGSSFRQHDVPNQVAICRKLVQSGADRSCYDQRGETPYMACQVGSAAIEALRPNGSWDTWRFVEEAGDLASVRALGTLDMADLLFCRHEGDAAELSRRRRWVFEHVIDPLLRMTTQGMDKDTRLYCKELLIATMGPQTAKQDPRLEYRADLTALLGSLMRDFARLADPLAQATKASDGGAELCLVPPVRFGVPKDATFGRVNQDPFTPSDLRHAALSSLPFAEKHVPSALQALEQAGALRTMGEVSELLQFGKHPYLLKDRPDLAQDLDGTGFWMLCTVLWMLALHDNAKPAFDETMKGMPGSSGLTLPERKKAERIIEKAYEYIAEFGLEGEDVILAPLLVVDVLRCTFVVPGPRVDLELGQALEAKLPMVRTKNGHSPQATSVGGYADRKFNLQFPSGAYVLVVEVQVLHASYVEHKKKMHGLYATFRGDHDHPRWRVVPET